MRFVTVFLRFLARDTGAQSFFSVPLAEAHGIFSAALKSTSGLCRTVRGPSMSCTPGKVEVTGIEEINGEKAFVLRFVQCRDESWIGRVFFAKYDPDATWFDELKAMEGMSLPWDAKGLPLPSMKSSWESRVGKISVSWYSAVNIRAMSKKTSCKNMVGLWFQCFAKANPVWKGPPLSDRIFRHGSSHYIIIFWWLHFPVESLFLCPWDSK